MERLVLQKMIEKRKHNRAPIYWIAAFFLLLITVSWCVRVWPRTVRTFDNPEGDFSVKLVGQRPALRPILSSVKLYVVVEDRGGAELNKQWLANVNGWRDVGLIFHYVEVDIGGVRYVGETIWQPDTDN